MATKRIYAVEATGKHAGSVWLVEAASQSQAVSHVVRSQYKATIATPRQVADLVKGGTEVETAGEAP